MRIASKPFEETLDLLNKQNPRESNVAFLVETAKTIVFAAEHLGALRETFISLADKLFGKVDTKLARSLANIYAFQFVCNVQLLIGYDDQQAAEIRSGK